MIGSFGLWSSSKGMKIVSDLVGKTRDDAKAKIVSDGFIVGTETPFASTSASDETNHNKVRSQDPLAGVLFTYELPINIVYTSFSFTPFSVFGFAPFTVFGFIPFGVFGFR
jgi:beta-lactam-binding protein with PASTA domain